MNEKTIWTVGINAANGHHPEGLMLTQNAGESLMCRDKNGKWSGTYYEEIKAQILKEITQADKAGVE